MTDVHVPPAQVNETKPPSNVRPSTPRRRGNFWFILVCLVCVGAAYPVATHFGLFGFGAKKDDAGAKPPVRVIPVVTATARKGDLNLYLTSLGTVTALNTVTIRSRVTGELTEVAFTEGNKVQEGSLLAQIDPRPYEVQLAQAEGQLARDEASLKDAGFTLERMKKLVAQKATTAAQLDTAQAAYDQLEGAIKSDKAQVDDAKLQLTYCRIIAPITGRIGLRRVDKGNLVQANDPNGLAVITQLEPIAVLFTVPQDEIFRVRKSSRDNTTLVVDAYNRDLVTKLAAGTLQAIDNQVDPATGTVRLKAVFPNEDQALYPNQFVNVRLLIETRRDAVLVPNTAVQQGPNSTFAYVVNSDETVELRNIIAGPTEGDTSLIESGLSAGEVVVTAGTDKLQPGSKVKSNLAPSEGTAARSAKAETPSGKNGQ